MQNIFNTVKFLACHDKAYILQGFSILFKAYGGGIIFLFTETIKFFRTLKYSNLDITHVYISCLYVQNRCCFIMNEFETLAFNANSHHDGFVTR